MRVPALGTWFDQAKNRLKLIAQAIATFCKCVLAMAIALLCLIVVLRQIPSTLSPRDSRQSQGLMALCM